MADTNDAAMMRSEAVKLVQWFAVIPVHADSKQPIPAEWQNRWTRNPAQLMDPWRDQRAQCAANIGAVCGAPSNNLIVIDVDNHSASNGVDTLTSWEILHGPLPETATAKTGSNGMHLFYYTDKEIPSAGACSKCGIDIQARGRYVMLPPSIHPSGSPYEWVLPPWIIPIAHADANVMAFIEHIRQDRTQNLTQPAQSTGRRLHSDRHRGNDATHYIGAYVEPARVGEGGRNVEMHKYVSHLWAQGYTAEDIAIMADQFNATICDPPLSSNEVAAIVRSVTTHYQQGHSAGWDAAHRGPIRKITAADKIEQRLRRRG